MRVRTRPRSSGCDRSAAGLIPRSVECEESGKDQAFQLFLRYDIDAAGGDTVTYRDLADRFDLPVTQVTNLLALARGRFREQVLSCLRELSGSEEEFRDDAAALLGIRDHA